MTVHFELFWQLQPLKVVIVRKRVVSHFNAVLHRQIEAGWCFSGSRYTYQNKIGFIELVKTLTVVIIQRIVNGIYSEVIILMDTVSTVGLRLSFNVKLFLNGSHKVVEKVIANTTTVGYF